MDAPLPKQYLLLAGQPMLIHTLEALLAEPRLSSVSVVLAADDEDFTASGCASRLQRHDTRVRVLRCGGDTRAASVRNGLRVLAGAFDADDWVLVHDAARPCLPPAALARLIDTLLDDPVGGLLAMPVADTLKRADAGGRAEATPSREGLWAAQTPQMFRLGRLLRALDAAVEAAGRPGGTPATDEAQAIEAAGARPRLVLGDPRNLKVTWPADVALAEGFLQHFPDTR
ncbi:MAG: 2-C-methyl-D-erythritol 4-phosphate cytidylyltransferase [Betaproteobacteria bacterium]|jgi:2-C-methyl-D-erythritol 4-phosphate cytidylyltransferase|nr:2-C-methyl-D-erythritol 4-phosphate cytidylyltransferase [Betaproteobacteria bacterium]